MQAEKLVGGHRRFTEVNERRRTWGVARICYPEHLEGQLLLGMAQFCTSSTDRRSSRRCSEQLRYGNATTHHSVCLDSCVESSCMQAAVALTVARRRESVHANADRGSGRCIRISASHGVATHQRDEMRILNHAMVDRLWHRAVYRRCERVPMRAPSSGVSASTLFGNAVRSHSGTALVQRQSRSSHPPNTTWIL